MFSAKAAGVGAREKAAGASDRSSSTLRWTVHAREKAAFVRKHGGRAPSAASGGASKDARPRGGNERGIAETARAGRTMPVDRVCNSERLPTTKATRASIGDAGL